MAVSLREIGSRIAAGIVIPPAAATIVFVVAMVSTSVVDPYVHSGEFDLGEIAYGLMSFLIVSVYGMPLSVAGTIVLGTARIWRHVPLVAVAAAVGIIAQIFLDSALASHEAPELLQNLGLTVWLIPAVFGVAALWLLKNADVRKRATL